MAKVRPAGFWFYGNEKFLLTVISIALGTTGFTIGNRVSDTTTKRIKGGRTQWGNTFHTQDRNLHSSPMINEYYHPVRCKKGNLLCILRVRTHENGYVSLLGVRSTDEIGGVFSDPLSN